MIPISYKRVETQKKFMSEQQANWSDWLLTSKKKVDDLPYDF